MVVACSDFDHALNAILPADDISLPTINDLPPRSLIEIRLEQCDQKQLTIVR